MNNTLLEKTRAQFCAVVFQKHVCKFKVDSLSRFRTGARQVFSLNTFSDQVPSVEFSLKSLTSNKSILQQES